MAEKLVLYDHMRAAIKQCAAIDEAAGIRDTAARVQAYAKIRDDFESQQRFAEIRLRACQKIGEISRDLEKAKYDKGHGTVVPTDGKYKTEVLAEAGISTSTANRYEELAGPKEEQAEAVIGAATDAYFAKQQETKEPVTFSGLRGAVKGALESTFGKRISRQRSIEKREPDLLVHFLYSPRWALEKQNFDPETLAAEVLEDFAPDELKAAELFIELLTKFVEHLTERFPYVTES